MRKQWLAKAPQPLAVEVNKAVKIRQAMHQHPELSWQENRSMEMVRLFLSEVGIPIECASEAGLVGRVTHPNSVCTVMLRAELDAIEVTESSKYQLQSDVPGVMHACGHDVHTAVVLTIAQWIRRTQLPIDLWCIFQRSEENWPSGAAALAPHLPAPPKPCFLVAFHVSPEHPLGSVVLRRGSAVAAVSCFRAEIEGKASHAAQPHQGVDAVAAAAQAVTLFYSLLSRKAPPGAALLSNIGTVNGGTRENILADKVVLTGTCRGENDATRRLVDSVLEQALAAACNAYGAEYRILQTCSYPAVENGKRLCSAVEAAFMGEPSTLVNADRCSMGGDDIGFLADHADEICYLFFGTRDENQETGPLHSGTLNIADAAIGVISSNLMRILAEIVDGLSSEERI